MDAPSETQNIANTFRRELSDVKLWWTRVLVIAAAAAAGLTVVGFTWLTEHALHHFEELRTLSRWTPLIWTPACTAAIVWLTRRFAPGATGSGIPDVMASVDPAVPPEQRHFFVSLRLSMARILLSTWGLLAGLSLGREGPSIQVAAGVMHSVRRWLPKHAVVSDHGLLVAGGVAGIAAAFNTPLAGSCSPSKDCRARPNSAAAACSLPTSCWQA